MISRNITRDAVIKATQSIDENGVPKNRLSTKYNLVYESKLYPPKYVLSLANEIVNGVELKHYEFGGGDESNSFLATLGFEIRGEQSHSAQEQSQSQHTKRIRISTAVLHCKEFGATSNTDRTQLLKLIIEADTDTDIILLPAGYYQIKKVSHRDIASIEKDISNILQEAKSSAIVCVGVDTSYQADQLAYAIGTQGIVAAGRKFYPTKGESTATATDYMAKENGVERVFNVNGFACYLAVCYDCFGIRHLDIKNPGVDIMLDLAHGFEKRGYGSSGDVDFARKGFAGASMQWQCPIFGTGVFFERKIPERWPTGVMWSGAESVKSFKYTDNQIHWTEKHEVIGDKESAIVYKFSVSR